MRRTGRMMNGCEDETVEMRRELLCRRMNQGNQQREVYRGGSCGRVGGGRMFFTLHTSHFARNTTHGARQRHRHRHRHRRRQRQRHRHRHMHMHMGMGPKAHDKYIYFPHPTSYFSLHFLTPGDTVHMAQGPRHISLHMTYVFDI